MSHQFLTFLTILLFTISSCRMHSDPVHGEKNDLRYTYVDSGSKIAIEKVHNYCHARERFSLAHFTRIHITSVGEIITGEKNGKRDVFEMYFDFDNGKAVGFDSHKDKFFYFSEIGGSSPDVISSFKTRGQNDYYIEIAYPWKILKTIPHAGKLLGFDFALTDNDNGFEQTKQVAWHSPDSDIWLNASLWGALQLTYTTSGLPPTDSIALSLFSKVKPVLDGDIDACWKSAPSYRTSHVLWGSVHNTGDHIDIQGSLQSLWDKDYLYFLVKVADDKIIRQSFQGKAFDFGWIEDSTGNKVWEMNRDNSKQAGGALKNRYSDTIIGLPAGNYYLCYHSDESHAFEQWDDTPPSWPLYGISLQKIP